MADGFACTDESQEEDVCAFVVRSFQKDPATGMWVTGLTDGEGCFYAGLNFREKQTAAGRLVSCVELEAQFSVALRADDRKTVEALRPYFGCGVVSFKKSVKDAPSTKKAGLKDPKPQVRFMVRKPSDLLSIVIPHFEMYPLRSKKANDFQVWKTIVSFAVSELVGKKGWLRQHPEKVEKLGSLCQQLRDGRKFIPQVIASVS